MFPHKKDQSFISVPVSRVGLSNRLNQLNNLNVSPSRISSRPGTPGATYVTSSLNPTKNLPVSQNEIQSKIKTPEELEKFNLLCITQSLRQFEEIFTDLSQCISSFKEDAITQKVADLIDVSQSMSSELNVLRQHLDLGKKIDLLLQTQNELDKEAKHILKELISCRSELKRLPKLAAAHDRVDPTNELNEVNVQEVLDYSMKLAKFSKAPATVVSQMIHPNNYIWPAEDALRRGMLAVASLKPDELIQSELGDDTLQARDVDMKDASPEMPEVTETYEAKSKDEQKTVAPKDPPKSPGHSKQPTDASLKEELAPNTLDLDLFDPDEDSDSD